MTPTQASLLSLHSHDGTLDLGLTTCSPGGDDDGETRVSVHTQRVLDGRDIEKVLVVLTRYWNGVFLGPDRFE